jgi:hypothetical protein
MNPVSLFIDAVWVAAFVLIILGTVWAFLAVAGSLLNLILTQCNSWRLILEYVYHREKFKSYLKKDPRDSRLL